MGEQIITKFVGLRAKTYSYLIYLGSEDNKRNSVSSEENLNLKIMKTV